MAAPRVDYEAAWEELQEYILTRDGWGTRVLITEMAGLRVKHKVPEASASAPGGMPTGERAEIPGTEDPLEDRDDSRPSSRAVRAA